LESSIPKAHTNKLLSAKGFDCPKRKQINRKIIRNFKRMNDEADGMENAHTHMPSFDRLKSNF
jgi:hypothetical protein